MWLFVSLLKTKKAAYCLDKLLSNNHLKWSGKRDSNSRPRPWQGRALPTELLPQEKFLWKFFLRRRSPAPRHNESKLSFCSRLVRPLPPCVWNRFHVFYQRRCESFPKKLLSKSVLSCESGAKVVVLGRLSKDYWDFF